MPAKPIAWSGKLAVDTDRAAGLRLPNAPAMRGGPVRNSVAVGMAVASPALNVTLPFELRKNPFQGVVQTAPTFPPKLNSNPPFGESSPFCAVENEDLSPPST